MSKLNDKQKLRIKSDWRERERERERDLCKDMFEKLKPWKKEMTWHCWCGCLIPNKHDKNKHQRDWHTANIVDAIAKFKNAWF